LGVSHLKFVTFLIFFRKQFVAILTTIGQSEEIHFEYSNGKVFHNPCNKITSLLALNFILSTLFSNNIYVLTLEWLTNLYTHIKQSESNAHFYLCVFSSWIKKFQFCWFCFQNQFYKHSSRMRRVKQIEFVRSYSQTFQQKWKFKQPATQANDKTDTKLHSREKKKYW